MRRLAGPVALAASLYVTLTVALTWPLMLHMGSRVPNDLGDSLLNMFLLAWNAREVPLTERWWSVPMYYPLPGVMAWSEHLLGLSPITTPVIAATGNVVLAYNIAFLLSFPLSALAAHLLAFELTRHHAPAVIAGLAYGFAPYRMVQFAHIQVLSAYWMPLAMLGLHLFLRTRRRRYIALFAASWLMQALACGYYLFYLSALVGLWLLWFAVGRLQWRDAAMLTGGWIAAGLALVPVALGYMKYQAAYGHRRWPDEIESFSADVASLLKAPSNLRLWGWLDAFERPEADLFPGLTIVILIVAGAVVAWSRAGRTGGGLRAARMLLLASAAVALVASTPLLFGPWRLEVGGIRLLSVSAPHKPLTVAVLLALVALVPHPSVRVLWHRRSPLAFYAMAAVVMWLFSLGPAPTLLGSPVLYKAPYAWLMMFPGVDGVRVPARFWVLATLCLAVAAGLGWCHLTRRWPRARVAAPLAAGLILLEAWPEPLRLERPPEAWAAHGRAVARIELPFSFGRDLVALYRAAYHERPLVNGYSGYTAPHYHPLRVLVERQHPGALEQLASVGAVEVVVDHQHDPAGIWRRYVEAHPYVERLHQTDAYTSYRVPRSPARRPLQFAGSPLPIAKITASEREDQVAKMIDGDRITRWDTGPMRPGNQVTLDFGRPVAFEGVEMQIGGYVADFPKELVIEVSDDGTGWREAWTGSAPLVALRAALEDPLNVPLRFALGGTRGRFLRMRQLAHDPVYYWSIAELRVYGVGSQGEAVYTAPHCKQGPPESQDRPALFQAPGTSTSRHQHL